VITLNQDVTVVPEFDVLIVDDDSANCLLLRKILEHHGNTVESAERLEEIRKLLDQKIPPVLILDLFMGDDNGFDILEELRHEYDLSATMVIIYTAQQIDYFTKKDYEKEYNCRILEKLLDQNLLFSMIQLRLTTLREENNA
jgi:CheY-like chemotaxis protein